MGCIVWGSVEGAGDRKGAVTSSQKHVKPEWMRWSRVSRQMERQGNTDV